MIGRRHVVPGEGFAHRGKRQLESESGDMIRPGTCTQGNAVRMVVLRATFDTKYFCFACDTGNRLVKGGIDAVALCLFEQERNSAFAMQVARLCFVQANGVGRDA